MKANKKKNDVISEGLLSEFSQTFVQSNKWYKTQNKITINDFGKLHTCPE